MWVGKTFDGVNFEENFPKLYNSLNKFTNISTNLPKTDINQYQNLNDLLTAISVYENRQRRDVKKVEGGNVVFDTTPETNHWKGMYKLEPFPIYDASKRLTSKMYIPCTFMCLSFHIKKQLGIGKGGMILTDNAEAVDWFKKARYEGRSEKFYKMDNISSMGWNMYMTPQEAAQGLCLMQNYPEHNADKDELNGYRDLTEFDIFKDTKKIS
jgi:hypothetical protein